MIQLLVRYLMSTIKSVRYYYTVRVMFECPMSCSSRISTSLTILLIRSRCEVAQINVNVLNSGTRLPLYSRRRAIKVLVRRYRIHTACGIHEPLPLRNLVTTAIAIASSPISSPELVIKNDCYRPIRTCHVRNSRSRCSSTW